MVVEPPPDIDIHCWPKRGVTPEVISIPQHSIELPKGFVVGIKKHSDPGENPAWVIKGRTLHVGATRHHMFRTG